MFNTNKCVYFFLSSDYDNFGQSSHQPNHTKRLQYNVQTNGRQWFTHISSWMRVSCISTRGFFPLTERPESELCLAVIRKAIANFHWMKPTIERKFSNQRICIGVILFGQWPVKYWTGPRSQGPTTFWKASGVISENLSQAVKQSV